MVVWTRWVDRPCLRLSRERGRGANFQSALRLMPQMQGEPARVLEGNRIVHVINSVWRILLLID